MAEIKRWDARIAAAVDDSARDRFQRERVRAAVGLLRAGMSAIGGDDAERLDQVESGLQRLQEQHARMALALQNVEEATRDPNVDLPAWLDANSFVGTAVVVGLAVVATVAAAPIGAAMVGDAAMKETAKAAITGLVSSALTAAGARYLDAKRERPSRASGIPTRQASKDFQSLHDHPSADPAASRSKARDDAGRRGPGVDGPGGQRTV